MSDETKPVEPTEAKSFNQEDVDRIVAQRLTRERDKYGDYDQIKKEAETLKAEKEKRDESELSENQKLQKKIELDSGVIAELNKHKEWREGWESAETEKIDSMMDKFSDEDKEIVNSVPLEKRIALIDKLSGPKDKPSPNTGKMYIEGKQVPTLLEARARRDEYGASDPMYKRMINARKEAGVLGTNLGVTTQGKEKLLEG